MDDVERFRKELRLSAAKSKSDHLEAELKIGDVENPAQILDDWEVEVKKWKDHPKLKQKEVVLRQIAYARHAIEHNDMMDFKCQMLFIVTNAEYYFSDLWTLKKEQVEVASREGGQKGGARDKKKKWAEKLAEDLVSQHPKESNNWICERVPEKPPYTSIIVDYDFEWSICRDGDKICAVLEGASEDEKITKRTFIDNYLAKAKRLRSNPP